MTTRLVCTALLVGACRFACAENSSLELPADTVTADALSGAGLELDRPVETGSRLGLSLRENPASVSIAVRAQIERVGARNFLDIATPACRA